MCFRQWPLWCDILCSSWHCNVVAKTHSSACTCSSRHADERMRANSTSILHVHTRVVWNEIALRTEDYGDVITRPSAPSFTGTSDLIFRTEYCSKLNWNKLLCRFNCFKISFTLFPHIRKIGNTTPCVKQYVTTPWRLFPFAFVWYIMKNVLQSQFLFVVYFVTSVVAPIASNGRLISA